MSGLIESLGINLPSLLAQVVNFVVLFVLLWLVAYRPVMRMLDARSQKVKESMQQTEQIRDQAKNAEEEIKKQITAGRKQGQDIIAQASKAGEELRQKSQQDARLDAEALITRARKEIQRERDEAIDELRKEFADLTVLAAGKVIERSLDKQAHRELIERVLEESTSAKKES